MQKRRDARLACAVLAFAASVVAVVVILASNVTIEAEAYEVENCGSVKSVLSGDFAYGGEQVWPEDYESSCRDAANSRMWWQAVPGAVALLALIYLGGVVAQARRPRHREADSVTHPHR